MTAVACRSCDKDGLRPVLSLGKTPLANSLLTEAQLKEPEATYPLDLAFCPACSLLQITESVPPEQLFSDYLYFSSFSDTMLRHAESIASRLVRERALGPKSLVVEIASNDGYLLQYYKRDGVPVLGIEPAKNIAKVARAERGIETLSEFFGAELAARLATQGRAADVLHANNVLAHVPDLNGVVKGIATVLAPDGVAVIEAPYVRDFVEHCEFDTIYHEHLCYFSLTALDRLFARQGLTIWDVERLPIHGGSLRIFASRSAARARGGAVTALLAEEAQVGITSFEFYASFAARVERLRGALRTLLFDLKKDGKRIAAYGAAAKGATLLNYVGVGTDVLDYVVDRSTHKQGHYMPGVRLPIFAPSKLATERPDFLLILAWNFADEIVLQQHEYAASGGRFIVPVPEPRLLA